MSRPGDRWFRASPAILLVAAAAALSLVATLLHRTDLLRRAPADAPETTDQPVLVDRSALEARLEATRAARDAELASGESLSRDGASAGVPFHELSGVALRAADGSPLPDARLRLFGQSEAGAHTLLDETRSGLDGAFTLRCPGDARPHTVVGVWRPARDTLSVLPPTLQDDTDAAVARLAVPDDAAARGDLRLALDSGWILCGRVMDAELRPVAEAVVSVNLGPLGRRAATDADGVFHITDLSAAREPLVARIAAHGFQSLELETPPPQGRPVVELSAMLQRGAALEGRVDCDAWQLADGRPAAIESAAVMVLAPGVPPRALADRDGRYELDDIPPGCWDVRCRALVAERDIVRTLVRSSVTVSPQETARLDFRFGPGAPLRGRLRDDAGPLADHVIEVWSDVPDAPGTQTLRLDGWVVTDADGAFSLEPLDPGPKRLYVLGPGERSRAPWAAPREPGAEPGAEPEPWLVDEHGGSTASASKAELMRDVLLPAGGLANLVLVVGEGPGLIAGSVEDEQRRPVPDAIVAVDGREDVAWARTDGAGRFSLHVKRLDQALVIRRTAFLERRVSVRHADEPQELDPVLLAAAPRLAGRVLDAVSGQTLTEFQVTATFSGGDRAQSGHSWFAMPSWHKGSARICQRFTGRKWVPAPDPSGADPWPTGGFEVWGDRGAGTAQIVVGAEGHESWAVSVQLSGLGAPQELDVRLWPRVP